MPAAQNHLIERLPRRDRARLLRSSEDVPLVLGEVLCEPGEPARHAWFPVDGFVSLVAPIDGKPALEVGMVGREGMLGAQLIRWCRAAARPGASAGPRFAPSWHAARPCVACSTDTCTC
jgi:hypothetical protein